MQYLQAPQDPCQEGFGRTWYDSKNDILDKNTKFWIEFYSLSKQMLNNYQ